MYHIRIDCGSDHAILSELLQLSEEYMSATENKNSENTHTHIYLKTDTPVQTIRNRIRKHNFTGNKSYSISTCRDKIKLLAYIQKDENPTVHNIPVSELNAAKEYDNTVKEDIKKKRIITSYDAIESLLLSLYPTFVKKPDYATPSVDECCQLVPSITETIIDTYIQASKSINMRQIQLYINTFLIKHSSQFKRQICENLAKQFP